MLKHLQARDDWNERSLGAKGFTLIELLVVIVILGILAGVAIFAVGNINTNAKKSACQSEKDTVKTAVQAYRVDNDGADPATTSDVVGATKNLDRTPKYWVVGAGGAVTRTNTADVAATSCS